MSHFKIGIITKPHGIRGEIRVYPTTGFPERFKFLTGMEIMVGSNFEPYKVLSARTAKGMAYIKLCGINDRTAVEKFIGDNIYISESQALPLLENEYFERDLIGMEVVKEDGESIGHVSKILYTPANDVYVIQTANGSAFMIPAIKEVIKDVSVANSKMVVRLIEGLEGLTL